MFQANKIINHITILYNYFYIFVSEYLTIII